MAQLQRALFRSFLRWNRRKYILEGRFRINPADFQCHELFPPSTIIQDAPGVQAAIYHAFRNTKASPNAINESVRILRELNEFALQVKETYEKRNLNSNEQTLAFAKFRVGQVVQKKESKIRAVVIGWKVNFTRKTQTVQILSDFDDTKKHTKFDIPIRPEFVTASELELVEDPMMMRIFHFDTDKYFIAFDEKYRRYIPNADLLYLYPRDFDTLHNPKAGGSTYPYGVSEVDKVFLEKIDHLVRYQGEAIHALSAQFFPWRQLPSTNTAATATPGKDDSDLMNCRIITDEILGEAWWRLSHIRQSEGSILPPTSRQANSNTGDNYGTNSTGYIPAGINLPYVEGFNQSLLYSDVPSHCLLPGKRLLLTGTKKADFERAKHTYQQQLHALHEPWNHIRNIYHRFGHFNEFLTLLEQILQLRFQSRGIGFHTSLYTTYAPSTNDKDTISGWQMHRHDFHTSVQQFLTTTQPLYPTIFQVGQVVRHKLYGFRGIVTGYDQRPLSDTSKRADLLANGNAIPRGKEQPFYRLLVDERDIALFREEGGHEHGQSTFDHSYLPEDCLEAVPASNEQAQHLLIISHPDIARYFLGWNQQTQRFRPRHQLKYAFPAEDHTIPIDYPAVAHHPILHVLDEKYPQEGGEHHQQTTAADNDSETSAPLAVDSALYQTLSRSIVREEVKIYENIDLFLVTLNGQMNTFLGNVVARHIDRLRRVQQERQASAAVSSTSRDTSSDNLNHCVPNNHISTTLKDDDTPIGKPTVTSRIRAKQRQQQQQQQQSGHTPHLSPVVNLEIADIHRLLQLAPVRFASLDVDLFLHKTLPSPPPGHRHNHDLQVLIRIAATHAIRGNFAETLHAMEHAILLEPLFFEAYFKQALAWSRLGDSHAMIKLSLQTLALSPNHLGAHYLLALAYANTKRKDQAVELMKQGLRLNPWAFNLASDLKTLLQE